MKCWANIPLILYYFTNSTKAQVAVAQVSHWFYKYPPEPEGSDQ